MDIKVKVLAFLKMGILMVLAFFISNIASKELFVNNTPEFRPNLPEYIATRLQDLRKPDSDSEHHNQEVIAKNEEIIQTSLQSVPFQSIAKGVQAKENTELKYVIIKDDEVEWKVYSFEINGKKMNIKVPKGEAPPSTRRLEQLYK